MSCKGRQNNSDLAIARHFVDFVEHDHLEKPAGSCGGGVALGDLLNDFLCNVAVPVWTHIRRVQFDVVVAAEESHLHL